MFNKYYQDELRFLRDLGEEFAAAYPTAAHFLASPGSDPDVERLLEGFAFLSARVRQKLDDELPELTHALMGLLWPHYLRPVPAMAVLEFLPAHRNLRETRRIPPGTEVESVPVEGTACRFRTAYDVPVHPLSVESVHLDTQVAGPARLAIELRLWNQVPLRALDLRRLRFFLHGEAGLAFALYLHLCRNVKRAAARPGGTGAGANRGGVELKLHPAGFGEDEGLLPYPPESFPGYALLQEYFAFPAKFLFIDLEGLERMEDLGVQEQITIEIEFADPVEATLRPGKENVRLYCTPIVNLFANHADPIRLDRTQTEYRVRPSGRHPLHYEIYSVDRVYGLRTGTAREIVFPHFYSFEHSLPQRRGTYYLPRLKSSVIDERVDTYLSFVDPNGEGVHPDVETISVELTCTNRRLPEALRIGDVNAATESSPMFAAFRNITPPSPSAVPPLDGDLHWRLISHLALNYLSLTDVQSLHGVLELYNFQAARDQRAARANVLRIEGIRRVGARSHEFMLRGTPVRGMKVEIEMQEDHFASEGDLYLFASVLNEFLALYGTLNSFTQLSVRGIQRGEVYTWPCRTGRQPLL